MMKVWRNADLDLPYPVAPVDRVRLDDLAEARYGVPIAGQPTDRERAATAVSLSRDPLRRALGRVLVDPTVKVERVATKLSARIKQPFEASATQRLEKARDKKEWKQHEFAMHRRFSGKPARKHKDDQAYRNARLTSGEAKAHLDWVVARKKAGKSTVPPRLQKKRQQRAARRHSETV
jgi:hypothetical protein